jgi:hypothetical protein|tara:strand:+ start:5821 stop:6081 length:261 start_codon:yes stop_codon:yes gene_type:complete
MTEKFEENSDEAKKNHGLTGKQKFLFGAICWGVQTYGQVQSFKENGYDQKYRDARKAIRTGMIVYGIGIAFFSLFLLLKYIIGQPS